WVEVLVPSGSGATVLAFDPTNGRRAGVQHVTVAVGRDYDDVAPTSGSYSSGPAGVLTNAKRVDITGFAYRRRAAST
ncbi:MAG: transglutaminase family protein, partial [Actinomycetota bacterium]|nr:transglutaminase family protein [Actinomycetota bacterium]